MSSEYLSTIISHETIRRKKCVRCGSKLFLEQGVDFNEWTCPCCGFREDLKPEILPLVREENLL